MLRARFLHQISSIPYPGIEFGMQGLANLVDVLNTTLLHAALTSLQARANYCVKQLIILTTCVNTVNIWNVSSLNTTYSETCLSLCQDYAVVS